MFSPHFESSVVSKILNNKLADSTSTPGLQLVTSLFQEMLSLIRELDMITVNHGPVFVQYYIWN